MLFRFLSACASPEPVTEPAPPPMEEAAPPSCTELPITHVSGEAWLDGAETGVTLLVRSAGGEHACVRLLVLDPQTGAARTEQELLFIKGYSTTSRLRWRGLDALGTLWLHWDGAGPSAHDLRTGETLLSPRDFWAQNPDLREHTEGDGLDARLDKHRRLVFSRDDGLRQFIDPLTRTARSVLEAEPPVAFVKTEQSPCDRGAASRPLRNDPVEMGAWRLFAEQEPGATWERQRLTVQTPTAQREVGGAFLVPEVLVDGAYSFDNQAWRCTPIGDDVGVFVQHVETLREQSPRLVSRIGGQGERLWQHNLGAGWHLEWGTQLGERLIVVGAGRAVALDVQRGSQVWRVGE